MGSEIGIPTGYRRDDDGEIVVNDEEFERVVACIKEIRKGRQIRGTAEHFGFTDSAIHSVLGRSEDYGVEFDKDDWWWWRRALVKCGRVHLDPLNDLYPGVNQE